MDTKREIRIRGAKEHNLQNIDLDIPRDQFVVLTGLSGSGKSSLAFDTIYCDDHLDLLAHRSDHTLPNAAQLATLPAGLF